VLEVKRSEPAGRTVYISAPAERKPENSKPITASLSAWQSRRPRTSWLASARCPLPTSLEA